MSDKCKVLLTPVGVYKQDEDGQGWTFLPKNEEEAALLDESLHHLTNEEAEQYFQHEIDTAELYAAFNDLCDFLAEYFQAMRQALQNIVCEMSPSIQEAWELLRELADETEEKEPKKPQRPDYGARPKCCTCAKTKRDRKQRSHER